MRIRELELAKNIKIEVTDVISSKEFIEIYLKNLEERNKELKGIYEKTDILAFLSARGHDKYNVWTAQKLK